MACHFFSKFKIQNIEYRIQNTEFRGQKKIQKVRLLGKSNYWILCVPAPVKNCFPPTLPHSARGDGEIGDRAMVTGNGGTATLDLRQFTGNDGHDATNFWQ